MNIIWRMGDGGAQQVLINYLRDLKNDSDIDFVLYVWCSKTKSKYARIIEEEGLNVKYLNGDKLTIHIPILRKIVNKIIVKRKWKSVIKEINPDIVHVHISEYLVSTLKPIIKNNVKIRFDTLHSNPLRFKGKKLRYIRRAFNKESFIPLCVNKEQAEMAKKYYGFNDYEIIRNGIDIDTIKKQIVSKAEARKKYNLSLNDFIVIGVGRLNNIKRFDLLIKAFSEIYMKNQNSKLLIAGEGVERRNLEKLSKSLGVKDSVIFLGNIDNVVPLYCAADVLGITSKSESASLVLLESQICDLRCVISDGVPSESIITNKVRKMNKGASSSEWAEALIDNKYIGNLICMPEDYEVHSISKRMKDIYLKYWKEYKENE